MGGAYYNEFDPYAAQWLRNLVAAGHIAPGEVDERSILDVRPDDLRGYIQCHFFAGLGGWSHALRLAAWSDDRPVWTGSCPCQPFSKAGKKGGVEDPRHLWPVWRDLIEERKPSVVFGEQVEGATEWLAIVRGDLEAMDYALGCLPLEAASAGADHFRDRYWFVADDAGRKQRRPWESSEIFRPGELSDRGHRPRDLPRALADATGVGGEESSQNPAHRPWKAPDLSDGASRCAVEYAECPDGKWRRLPPPGVRWLGHGIPARVAKLRAFGNAIDPRPASQFIAAFMECRP